MYRTLLAERWLLPQLQVLDLSDNQISGTLPASWSHLTNVSPHGVCVRVVTNLDFLILEIEETQMLTAQVLTMTGSRCINHLACLQLVRL